jgi:hypothetical protein
MSKHTIHVRLFHERWVIEFQGIEYGQYCSKAVATSTAQLWAQNAAKHGHFVQIVIHSHEGPAFNLVIVRPVLDGSRGVNLH